MNFCHGSMHACLLCFIFQLERTYQQKSDSLLQKERNSIERMQREQEVVYWQYVKFNFSYASYSHLKKWLYKYSNIFFFYEDSREGDIFPEAVDPGGD